MPSEFEETLKEYLKPYKNDFNYENMLQGHLNTSRFFPWIAQASEYRTFNEARVLSSGCGSGGDLYAFMVAGASSAYGIEIDYRLTQLAKIRSNDFPYQTKVNTCLYDGDVLPFKEKSFDIIFSLHVLEHTRNPSKYLEELFRVLAPEGIIFLDLPNRYYSIEQHTLIKYIHYLPMKARNTAIKMMLSKFKLSEDMRYRLSTLVGFNFLSPAQIINVFNQNQKKFHLRIMAAYFHSYGEEKVNFRYHPMMYILGKSKMKSTFRIVVLKTDL